METSIVNINNAIKNINKLNKKLLSILYLINLGILLFLKTNLISYQI